MSTYLIGDIHGCYKQLRLLLKQVSFNSYYDDLWITGDLVSRGLYSLEVLRYLQSLGDKVKVVLGNHDMKVLFIYAGLQSIQEEDNLNSLFEAYDIDTLISWLRNQSFLCCDNDKKIIMTHAGIYPFWDIKTSEYYAKKIEFYLSGSCYKKFLHDIKNYIFFTSWNNKFDFLGKLCFSLNVFTRMRYLKFNGDLDMIYKNSPSQETKNNCLIPWFSLKNKIDSKYSIFFGHWASLKSNIKFYYDNIIPLDTGCCWGGKLSMMRWDDKKWFFQSFY